jgi:hypothetical protein
VDSANLKELHLKTTKSSVHLELVSGSSVRQGLATLSDDELEFDDQKDGEVIDIVVSHIKRLTRTASLEYAIRVGAVIIHHFYDGDTNAWRARGPKTISFRRLSEHPELPMSAGALYRCVAVFELCDRWNAPSRWNQLTASHFRLVLGLPPSKQEKLLSKANAGRWTVKALQEQVLWERRGDDRSAGGRRPEPPIKKGLRAVRKCLSEYGDTIAQFDALSSEDVQESIRLLEETKTVIARLSETLSTMPRQKEMA